MKILFSLSIILFSLNGHTTGGIDGGGGNGVVCRDQNQNISHVRLLDLFEGEVLHQLVINESLT